MTQGEQADPEQTELLATRATTASPASEAMLAVDERFGHYRIEALLGRGGMGEVYRAHQLEPVQRTVALKLLRAQRLTARHIAYFEVERQLLAQMRHPAIAQIFDAGTSAEGQPYFAMEFIAGKPITHWCDENRLPLEARIALFIKVCEGVQHAHQKGVIHRDLKPGNLLVDVVDGRPLPKIIDFGIATASTLGSGLEVAGTPDYMSPEQASGDQALVDTRSDVYALGVVLCELLTGQRPVAGGETITNEARSLRLPSQQLSTLSPVDADKVVQARGQSLPQMRRLLRGELDHVVAKAMRFERSERYPSAAALAEDLQRFLDGRPLQAVPASRRYVWRKFAQRHRSGIAAAALVTLALVGGLALSVYGLLQARAQRTIAEQRNAQLEKVAAFQQSMLEGIDIEAMGLDVGGAIRGQLGNLPEAETALERGLAPVSMSDVARGVIDRSILRNAERVIGDQFAGDPELAADLRESVAKVRIALGLPDAAATGFGQVADYRARALGETAPQTLSARQEQVHALLDAARAKEAQPLVETALRNAQRLPVDDPLRIKLRLNQAGVITALGDRPRARTLLETLRADAIRLRGERDPVTMDVTNNLAILLGRMGEPDAGRELMEALVPMREQVLGKDDFETLDAQHNLAIMRIMTGDAEGAVALQRELVSIQTRRLGAEHPTTLKERGTLSTMLIDSGKPEEALPIAIGVVEADVRVLGAEHPQALRAKLNLSTLYARLHQFDKALEMQQEVVEARTRLLGPRHPDTLYILVNRAGSLHQAKRSREALALLAQMLPLLREVLGVKHPQTQSALDIRGQSAEAVGETALAIDSYRELLPLREDALGADDNKTIATAWRLQRLLRLQGDVRAADALRGRYVAPLLQARPDALDDGGRKLRDMLLAAERKGGPLEQP